jgi:hypothetical protein
VEADYSGAVSENGDSANSDSSTDDSGPGNRIVPKLTIGQRVLASLPNLQRPTTTPAEPPPKRPGPARAGAGAPDADDADDVVTPDDVLAPGADAVAPRGKLRDAFLKPAQSTSARSTSAQSKPAQRGAPSGMTKEELTHVIKRLEDRERTMAFFAAPLGAAVGILLTVVTLHTNPPLHAKNHLSTSLIVFEGGARILLAGVVALAAWTRRRSFVAFALLFLGTSMAGGLIFALPFWALGIWLIFRVFKWQKELATMTGGTAARGRSQPAARPRSQPAARGREAAEARRRARAERISARTAGGRRSKKQPEPAGPPKNKRYTPPKQIRPRPPGS